MEKFFSSHTVNPLSLIDLEYNNSNNNDKINNKNHEVMNDTTKNTIVHENHTNGKPVSLTDLTQTRVH